METTYPTQRSRRNSLTRRPVSASAGARRARRRGLARIAPRRHGWLVGDRRQALCEFAGLVEYLGSLRRGPIRSPLPDCDSAGVRRGIGPGRRPLKGAGLVNNPLGRQAQSWNRIG
jgi:hypothetical protein